MRKRLLVTDFRVPAPDQDSGSNSTMAYLGILSRAGYEITFIPQRMDADPRYVAALNALGIRTACAPAFPALEDAVTALAPGMDIALLYRAGVSARAFDIIRAVSPATRIIFHPVDLHFLRMRRQAEISGDPALAQSAQNMRVRELSLLARADARIVVSAAEQEILRMELPDTPVTLIPIMRPIPPEHAAPDFANRRDIAFIGAFAHRPNADGITWFVQAVWPLLVARGFPGRLLIAGAFVTPEITALAQENIVIRGHVPDLATFFDGIRLSIAPLRYGAGVKGKIVSSLSLKLPVVASAIAAEGMALRHGEDVLIAGRAEEMAEHILAAYSDPALWQHLAENGYQTFLHRFSETAGEGKLLALLAGFQQDGRI